MSRMPPIPAANQSPYGPDAGTRDATDLPHHADLPFVTHGQEAQEQHRGAGAGRGGIAAPEAVDDLGGTVPAQTRGSDTLMLVVFGALVAAIVWVAGRQRGRAG